MSPLLVVVCAVFLMAGMSDAAPTLKVEYPEELNENYSVVTLSCIEDTFPIEDAVYLREGVELDNSPVTIIDDSDPESVTFAFTQQQEGRFACRGPRNNDPISPEIGLAASPPVDYEGKTRNRYIIFPTADSPRSVILECDIEPGALPDRYSYVWNRFDTGLAIVGDTQDLTGDVLPDEQYQCRVTIIHKPGTEVTYDGPIINIVGNVLASFDNGGGIEDVSAVQGENATLTCNFTRGDNNISVLWSVGENQYNCSEEGEVYVCTIDNDQSRLQLLNTASLDVGTHRVQCILEQNIPEKFQQDPLFDDSEASSTAKLTIMLSNPTSGSSSTGLSVGGVIAVSALLLLYSSS